MTNSNEISKYSKIKNILKEEGYAWEEKPSQKAYNLLVYIRRLSPIEKFASKFRGKFSPKRKTEQYMPPFKEKIGAYSKENIEEAIIYKLNKLHNEGVFRLKNTNSDTKPIIYQWAYEGSLGIIKDINDILSQKRLLRKKGISETEIRKYNETFNKRINLVIKEGKKYAELFEDNKFIENLLKYRKRDNSLDDMLTD